MQQIPVSDIGFDDLAQPRIQMNMIVAVEYADAYKEDKGLPPIDVVFDGETYWVWDGWHRVEGAKKAGLEKIPANVEEGTVDDARWKALGANKTHGLRRTNEDKRRAVELALEHPQAVTMSNQMIADHCGVNESYVWKLRQESTSYNKKLPSDTPIGPDGQPMRKGKDGKWRPATKKRKTKKKQHPSEKLLPEVQEVVRDSPVVDPEPNRELRKLSNLEPDLQKEVAQKIADGEAATVKEALIDERKEQQEIPPLPTGKYHIIYADPPWKYEHSKTDSRNIIMQYLPASLDEICEIPVANMAASDSMLFLWATSPKLEEAFRVINAWGFTYRTCMVWVKDKIGMGYYARQQHELLLIARRGTIAAPEPANRPSSVIEAPRTKHSAKPKQAYTLIEQMYPNSKKLELFAREARSGWESWGDEV